MLNNTVDRDTVLTKDGGGSFSIGAISLATTNVVSGSFDLLFTGTKSDNSTVDQTFSIDNTTYALETFLFSSAFTDIVSLRWTQGSPSHQFDNLVLDEAVSAVPAPAGFFIIHDRSDGARNHGPAFKKALRRLKPISNGAL